MGRPKGSKNGKTKVKTNVKTKNENVSTENDETQFIPEENSGNVGDVGELKFNENTSSETNDTDTPEQKIGDIMAGFSTEAPAPTVEQPEQLRTRKPRTKKGEPAEQVKMVIPAKLFLKVHNRVLIGAVQFADKFSKNPIPYEYLQHAGLSEEDLKDEDLLLAAQECIKAMKIESNPIAAFYLSFGMMAATNYMGLKAYLKQKQHDENPNANIKM
jgi:hypothetical protein